MTPPTLLHLYYTKPLELYVGVSFEGLGAALHPIQLTEGNPVEGPVALISRQLKVSENRYASPHLEPIVLVWALVDVHCVLNGRYFEVIEDFNGVISLMIIKTPIGHM